QLVSGLGNETRGCARGAGSFWLRARHAEPICRVRDRSTHPLASDTHDALKLGGFKLCSAGNRVWVFFGGGAGQGGSSRKYFGCSMAWNRLDLRGNYSRRWNPSEDRKSQSYSRRS